ncbi:unnamed protein product [Dracunculus medinensis]|uniref:CLIP domain-containing serine protease n=1 Tax=Dracunculus medinensis TaxID=318479 RepID=A0A0N4UL55_DRAME|nr:unnamed protein product [Dracunculus medinensis]
MAFANFYDYLRNLTISEEQCGQCSYQQSCGRQCHRRGSIDLINPLFVAERPCKGISQTKACVSNYVDDCKHWPNHEIALPNITDSMMELINKLDYLSCVPEKRSNGDVCRCCCHPYRPDPRTFECQLKLNNRGRS